MKTHFKFKVLLCAISVVIFSVSAFAYDEDIQTEELFTGEKVYYQPISADDLEAEKVTALKAGDSKKLYIIGMMYRDGNGVDADPDQAREWFKSAADAGNSEAMVELARIYSLDPEFTGVEKDPNNAKKWILEAEKRNNPKAYYTMGLMYEEGFPFERSNEKAFEYYQRAAFKGILNAYVKVYIAYQYGKGVEPNVKKAIEWLRKIEKDAPDGGIKDYAKKMLSEAYFEMALKETDPSLKFRLMNLSWSNGNRYAIEAIGDMMQAGQGVKQSYSSAVVAYETAIKKYESIYAMERLGFIYVKGPGDVDKDYKRAAELFSKAADLGGVTAAYMMGYMNFYGLGMPRDAQKANTWFSRSSQLLSSKKSRVVREVKGDRSSKAIQNIISEVTEKQERQVEESKRTMDSGVPNAAPLPDMPRF